MATAAPKGQLGPLAPAPIRPSAPSDAPKSDEAEAPVPSPRRARGGSRKRGGEPSAAVQKFKRAKRPSGDDRKLKKNTREKQRRLEVNQRFCKLSAVLDLASSHKADKVSILDTAIDTIQRAREQVKLLQTNLDRVQGGDMLWHPKVTTPPLAATPPTSALSRPLSHDQSPLPVAAPLARDTEPVPAVSASPAAQKPAPRATSVKTETTTDTDSTATSNSTAAARALTALCT